MRAKAEALDEALRVRLDQWLWAARFYKTRSLAAQAIGAGQARVNGERVKPARPLKQGDRVTIRRGGLAWEVDVTALSKKRGGAAEAAKLYCEAADSIALREQEIAQRKAVAASAPAWPGRPSKRDRRKLQEFLDES